MLKYSPAFKKLKFWEFQRLKVTPSKINFLYSNIQTRIPSAWRHALLTTASEIHKTPNKNSHNVCKQTCHTMREYHLNYPLFITWPSTHIRKATNNNTTTTTTITRWWLYVIYLFLCCCFQVDLESTLITTMKFGRLHMKLEIWTHINIESLIILILIMIKRNQNNPPKKNLD